MLRMAEVGPGDIVYDLGCGDGRMVIAAARDFGARGVGVDLDAERVREARAAAVGAGDQATFIAGDLLEVDLRDASVVCVYLPRSAYDVIGRFLRRTLSPGARVVSHDIAFPGWPPTKAEIVRRDPIRTSIIYSWTIPDRADTATAVYDLSALPLS
jgi:cyclopropane fatty-acyl-phospholipid synthase-like methyltransferase